MIFGRRRHGDRRALRRLADWALGQHGTEGELERLFGQEHAAELGPLGWIFRAIELEPVAVPTLGRWQQFERELRQRLDLLPPPRAALSGLAPPVLFLPAIDPAAMRAAVGELTWKTALVVATTTTVPFQLISSGMVEDLRRGERVREIATQSTEFRPTGNVMIDRLRLNEIALTPGLDPSSLAMQRWRDPGPER